MNDTNTSTDDGDLNPLSNPQQVEGIEIEQDIIQLEQWDLITELYLDATLPDITEEDTQMNPKIDPEFGKETGEFI